MMTVPFIAAKNFLQILVSFVALRHLDETAAHVACLVPTGRRLAHQVHFVASRLGIEADVTTVGRRTSRRGQLSNAVRLAWQAKGARYLVVGADVGNVEHLTATLSRGHQVLALADNGFGTLHLGRGAMRAPPRPLTNSPLSSSRPHLWTTVSDPMVDGPFSHIEFVDLPTCSDAKPGTALFIGQPLPRVGLVPESEYLAAVLDTHRWASAHLGSDGFEYAPHPAERRATVERLRARGLRVLPVDGALEYLAMRGELAPSTVMSFSSTSLLTLPAMIKGCTSVEVRTRRNRSLIPAGTRLTSRRAFSHGSTTFVEVVPNN